MEPLKLPGLDGSHLFGFLATLGRMRLLNQASLLSGDFQPSLRFDQRDCCAVLEGAPSVEFVERAVCKQMLALRYRLRTDFQRLNRPADLAKEMIEEIAKSENRLTLDELAGFGCDIGGEVHESTLCAANGAGHQKLIRSMRDVLALLRQYPHLLSEALNRAWLFQFEPTPQDRRKLALGNRKPTLRLDPSDERLYALRLDDPSSDDTAYRTELGAQALAAAAFGGLPVVPRSRHSATIGSERKIAIGSERKKTKDYFYWGLWSVPASYPTIRSYLATGMRDPGDARSRGGARRFAQPA